MLAELLRYLGYPFVRYAIVAAMLISLCSALVGVILVLKRYSYIGDGLSHVAFGAMSIALVLGTDSTEDVSCLSDYNSSGDIDSKIRTK